MNIVCKLLIQLLLAHTYTHNRTPLQVFNYPLPPEPEDESTAQQLGWLPPAPVKSLLSDYTITVNLPPLFEDDSSSIGSDSSCLQGQPAAAAAANGHSTDGQQQPAAANGHDQAAAAAVNGVAPMQVDAGGSPPAAAAANSISSGSSLPSGLAARMRPVASPQQVRTDVAPAAAAVANGLPAAVGLEGWKAGAAAAGGGERKRGRSDAAGGDSGTKGATGTAAGASAAAAAAVPSRPMSVQLPRASINLSGSSNGTTPTPATPNASTPLTPPAAKKAKSAAAAADGGQCALSVAERRARLAFVPLPSRSLVLMALTAASCHEAFDFERLEFLGDVILKALAAHVMLGVSVCGGGVAWGEGGRDGGRSARGKAFACGRGMG